MAEITPNQLKLFEELHKSRLEDFKTFNKKSYRGVWSSIVDKYPESAHFVYELLQNADDAEATEVEIMLKRDMMLFKHNGTKHFDITSEAAEQVGDINSITGIGDSSKIDTQNKIGKFGVGFKAVFQYTDTPEIYDDYFKFKIENYIVPTLIPHDHPERQEGETLFVFPFKNGNEAFYEINMKLERLQNPILFLRHLQRIVISINGLYKKEYIYKKESLDSIYYTNDNITLDYYRLHEPSMNSDVLLFSSNVQIEHEDGTQSNHLINVGYFYDPEKKALITDTKQYIYCFFPTKETFNTCFVSHAPFLLTDNRQNLKPGERLNKKLVLLIANLAAKALVYLRDYRIEKGVSLINENIAKIIPNCYHYYRVLNDMFEIPINDAFKNIINSERLLLSRNKKYLSLKEAYIGTPKELVDLLSKQQMLLLRNKHIGSVNIRETGLTNQKVKLFDANNIDFLKWELVQEIDKQENYIYDGINSYSSEDFANDIDADFMDLQDSKWVSKLYTFLRTAAPKLWKVTDKSTLRHDSFLPFRYAPIIKTQKGEWVAPFINITTPNVFLPLKDDCNSEYNFIANEFLNNDPARRFFNELGITEPDELTYIQQVILKKFEAENISINKEDLKSDFEVLVGYYTRIKGCEKKEEPYLSQVKNKIYLYGSTGYLSKPTNLYIYSEKLELYFKDTESISFLDLDFYETAIQKYGKMVVEDFVIKLGVKQTPTIISKRLSNTWLLNMRIRIQISTIDYQEYHIDDFELEGFKELCIKKIGNKRISLYIWNEVLPAIKFSQYGQLTVVYRKKYARSNDKAYFTSSFKDALMNCKWIFDINGNSISAKDIVLEDLSPEYDRNNGLVQFLGIKKREKSIIELGGTEEQQQLMEYGEAFKDYQNDFTKEEIRQILEKEKCQRQKSLKLRNSIHEVLKENYSFYNANQIDTTTNCHNPAEKNILNNRKTTDNGLESINKKDANRQDIGFSRNELRNLFPDEMFLLLKNHISSQTNENSSSSEEGNKIDVVEQFLIEQEEKRNKIKELQEQVKDSSKYTKEWFEALIELEYRGNAVTERDLSNKSISITFNSIGKENDSKRIYIFKNPSCCIPTWMEEIGDIEVKCVFSDREELKLKFEVANVRENSLRLKASKAYESMLSKIDWDKCTKASITLKNQIDLMGKVRIAFKNLNLKDGFNLKDNLQDNIQFIFGPPGTGKTTTLAKKIISQMEQNTECKILVLAPTNTACDELARKIQEYNHDDCTWLHRFISTADENLEDIVIDRESTAYKNNKCCIIATIARLSFDGFNGVGGFHRLSDIIWDSVICDEASMIPLAEIALAIYTFSGTPICIAGDPMQIKPILREEEWKNENIYTMVKLDRFDQPKTEPIDFTIENLDTQYRSVPAIGNLFSNYAYNGKLKHFRSALPTSIRTGKIEMKPINFIPFKVERYDSIFGIKKLDGSNVHIYSALLTVEMYKYMVKEYTKVSADELSIGIVCPYSPQAQLIESLIGQISGIPAYIKTTIGTVHRFQGGQCNIMLVVLNPPLGIKNASDRIFLNNKNILNVAISRAQDHLCILLPHRDTEGYENLYEINSIGSIAMKDPNNVAVYTCDQIEEIIFNEKFHIENNTFVTSHQLTNVYTQAAKKYEVRIDEKSVDIQLSGDSFNRSIDTKPGTVTCSQKDISDNSIINNSETDETKKSKQHIEVGPIEDKQYEPQIVEFIATLDKSLQGMSLLVTLIKNFTPESSYVAIQIAGNSIFRQHFGFTELTTDDIKQAFKNIKVENGMIQVFRGWLDSALHSECCRFRKMGKWPLSKLSFTTYRNELKKCEERQKRKKIKRDIYGHLISPAFSSPQKPDDTFHHYDRYEYGLSDW